VGFEDEVWWSRVAHPRLHAWAEAAAPLRLQALTPADNDPEPPALACYGLLVRYPARPATPERMLLRFVHGRPVSAITCDFLHWCCQKLARQRVKVWVLIWDNAGWHLSKVVRTWIRTHNQQVKRTGQGVRILSCFLPSKSPWLNPIEPKWLHGKRAIVEPARILSADELAERVCTHFGCAHEPHLSASANVT
jgi:transposase